LACKWVPTEGGENNCERVTKDRAKGKCIKRVKRGKKWYRREKTTEEERTKIKEFAKRNPTATPRVVENETREKESPEKEN